MANIRNWLWDALGNPVVGADVYVYDASLLAVNPNTLLSQTTTSPDGMFSFTALTDTEKDIKAVKNGQTTWFKGFARHAVSDLYANLIRSNTGGLQNVGQGSTPSAPGTGIGMVYFKTDGLPYMQYASGGEIRLAKHVDTSASIMTTRGDLVIRNATVPARLAVGANKSVLSSDGTDPSWQTIPTIDGVNVGSATGATSGMVKTSGNVQAGGALYPSGQTNFGVTAGLYSVAGNATPSLGGTQALAVTLGASILLYDTTSGHAVEILVAPVLSLINTISTTSATNWNVATAAAGTVFAVYYNGTTVTVQNRTASLRSFIALIKGG